MKLRILIFLLGCTKLYANALSVDAGKQQTYPICETDKNEQLGFLTDIEYSNLPIATLLNNVFIKSDIGIDLNKIEKKDLLSNKPFMIYGVGDSGKDSIAVSEEITPDNPIVINNKPYIFVQNLVSSQDIDLLSLHEIKESFCPDVKGPCLYMINKFFITNDIESYKLDRNFVLKVEVLPSSEIDFFKDKEPFNIIRIFTNIPSNRFPSRLR